MVEYVAELLIRAARPTDVPDLARLHLASYRAAYRDLLPAAFLAGLTLADRERRWHASLANPERQTFTTNILNGPHVPLVGLAEIGRCRDTDAPSGAGELIALHIAEAYWRQGIGERLHDRAAVALAERGFAAATLWVLTGNEPARAFYAAMGWSADGQARDITVDGVTIPEVRYVIRLR
jgi:ribosomal protein S18 acetylase RimI-like enzyme